MPAGLELLNTLRVNRVVQAIQDTREVPQDLLFNRRIPDVPATEGEILARIVNRPQIADIISDDGVAAVYNYGKMTFETTPVPNLKHGRSLNQEQINQLASLNAPAGVTDVENSAFATSERGIIKTLLNGIDQRKEALKVAMCINGLNYARLGMNLTGITWGMPADLNVVPAFPWTDATNGDAVNDLLSLQLLGRVRYGIELNRVTMSTQAFRYIIAQAKFQAQAKAFLPAQLTFSNFNLNNLGQFRQLFEATTGFTITLYDARYFSQAPDGSIASYPYLPINKVVVDNATYDGDGDVWNFGECPTTESILMGMMRGGQTMTGRLAGGSTGPIGYATYPHDMNPPNVTYWAVSRGWPRKMMLQASACLTVGAFADSIPIGEPF